MIKKDLTHMRQHYATSSLLEEEANPDPFLQFGQWLDQAIEAGLPEPNAMTLATAGKQAYPSARVVLLKELDDQGFVFFSNYHSRKGLELEANPHAALVFLWLELQRQVRVEGVVLRISEDASDAYFLQRPRSSQLGALASPQSVVIDSREWLEDMFSQVEKEHENRVAQRPSHWGGYRLIPEKIEFWQGRPNRLHDRLLYQRSGTSQWEIKRLAP